MKGVILAFCDSTLEQSFDISQMDLFTDTAKRDSDTAGSGPCCSADAVDITLGFIRHIIVDDVCNAGDINSS